MTNENITFFPIVIFIDNFELYKNIYKNIIDVYVMLAKLTIEDYQRNSNVYTITFGFYGSNFDKIISCLQINLRTLDCGSVMEINKRKQYI